jgi:hypothetical protein
MSVQRNIEMIREILANLESDHDEDNHLRTLHQLGYLMGVMARMANNDSQVYYTLKQELEKVRKNRTK